jgi:hypothetical protein
MSNPEIESLIDSTVFKKAKREQSDGKQSELDV